MHGLHALLILLIHFVQLHSFLLNQLADFLAALLQVLSLSVTVCCSIVCRFLNEVASSDLYEHILTIFHDSGDVERRGERHHDFSSTSTLLHVGKDTLTVGEFLGCLQKLLVVHLKLLGLSLDSLFELDELLRGDLRDVDLLVGLGEH